MRKILGTALLVALAASTPVHAGPLTARDDVSRRAVANWWAEQYDETLYTFTDFSLEVNQQNSVTTATLWKSINTCTITDENWDCTYKSFVGELVADAFTFSFDDSYLDDASLEGSFLMHRINDEGRPVGKGTTVDVLAIWNGTEPQERHQGTLVQNDNDTVVVHRYTHANRQAVAGLTVNNKTLSGESWAELAYDKVLGADNQG